MSMQPELPIPEDYQLQRWGIGRLFNNDHAAGQRRRKPQSVVSEDLREWPIPEPGCGAFAI